MGSPNVRDVQNKYNLWAGFRDELIATAMTLSLLVLGSFIVTERIFVHPKAKQSPSQPSAVASVAPSPQTLGVQDTAPTPSPTLSSLQRVTLDNLMASEGARVYSEVPYGENGYVEFPGYVVSFKDPRIGFDKTTNLKRQMLVDIEIFNRSIAEGIDVRLSASIVKDGKVIIQDAALSIPESRALAMGEKLTTTAKLSLIEGTDIRELKFKPGHDLPVASHFLNP